MYEFELRPWCGASSGADSPTGRGDRRSHQTYRYQGECLYLGSCKITNICLTNFTNTRQKIRKIVKMSTNECKSRRESACGFPWAARKGCSNSLSLHFLQNNTFSQEKCLTEKTNCWKCTVGPCCCRVGQRRQSRR